MSKLIPYAGYETPEEQRRFGRSSRAKGYVPKGTGQGRKPINVARCIELLNDGHMLGTIGTLLAKEERRPTAYKTESICRALKKWQRANDASTSQ